MSDPWSESPIGLTMQDALSMEKALQECNKLVKKWKTYADLPAGEAERPEAFREAAIELETTINKALDE